MLRDLECTLEHGGLHNRTVNGVIQELDVRAIRLTVSPSPRTSTSRGQRCAALQGERPDQR